MNHQRQNAGGILVSDFDGTMTRHDFYKLAIESLIPSTTPAYWGQYREGAITHFEALKAYFAAIQGDEEQVMAVVRRMELDPKLPAAVESLKRSGWSVVIASAGCEWYIRELLGATAVHVAELHANPGRFVTGQGLVMEMPVSSPFWSPTLGVDKAKLVRYHLTKGQTVAFAGDGFPDAEAARLVPAELLFARGDLAEVLSDEKRAFHAFDSWVDIADTLAHRGR